MAIKEHTMSPSKSQPPPCDGVEVTFPEANIMLVTLSRAKQMNSITHTMNWQIENLFDWYDNHPSLRVAVITGSGAKAFCAGSDLKEIEQAQQAKLGFQDPKKSEIWLHEHPKGGFAGVSRRKGKKPMLAAVNGLALGGGFEIVLNRYAVNAWKERCFCTDFEPVVTSPSHLQTPNSVSQKLKSASMHTAEVYRDSSAILVCKQPATSP